VSKVTESADFGMFERREDYPKYAQYTGIFRYFGVIRYIAQKLICIIKNAKNGKDQLFLPAKISKFRDIPDGQRPGGHMQC
jgi:hypothetical protein